MLEIILALILLGLFKGIIANGIFGTVDTVKEVSNRTGISEAWKFAKQTRDEMFCDCKDKKKDDLDDFDYWTGKAKNL